MVNKVIQEALNGLMKNSDYQGDIIKIALVLPKMKEDNIIDLLRFAKKHIADKHNDVGKKTRALRLIKGLMETKNEVVVYYVGRKIVNRLLRVFSLPGSGGFDGWVDVFLAFDMKVFEFFILALKCVENWTEGFGKAKGVKFLEVYQELKTLDAEFPPFFLFEQTPPNGFSKKDLQRSRRLCKELKKFLTVKTKKKASVLNTLCEIYLKEIEQGIKNIEKNKGKVSDDLIWTYSEISESLSLYQSWRANGYQNRTDKKMLPQTCAQLEDITPKSPPSPDALSDSMEQRRSNSLVLESSFRESIKEEINISEYYRLREKLIDNEELVSMYKDDLAKLQSKFIDATEKKEELKYRINAILFSNKEINNLLTEANKKTEDLASQNFSLVEDVEAFRSQNDSLKLSIREIQEVCIKYEKEYEKQKKYLENLENRNSALADSNLMLTKELEKLKEINEHQIPNIYLNPKHEGDIENSYHISRSEDESRESIN